MTIKSLPLPKMTGRPMGEPMGLTMPVIFGAILIACFFGGFGAWAYIAPLQSAAIAPGVVIVEGNRKQVQHLEGGIVAELFIKEGQSVVEGDPLIRLDDTQAKASATLLRSQLRAAEALEARLIAERDDYDEVRFPDWIVEDAKNGIGKDILTGQEGLFLARKEALESQLSILDQRTAQIHEEILGLEAEIKTQDRQLALIGEEIKGIKTLLDKGLERKPRLLALQRTAAEIEGARAQNRARIARALQSIGENELRATDLHVQLMNQSMQELREVQDRIADLRERIHASEDILARTLIRAPASGRIVGLKIFTKGGVVSPRDTLMNIVPQDDTLIVEAQVSPIDVDDIQSGLPVQLRFTTINSIEVPVLNGLVESVSADRLNDPNSDRTYFSARISVDPDQPEISKVTMTPGMPVEAIIITGERTALDYLVKPLTASFTRALRENEPNLPYPVTSVDSQTQTRESRYLGADIEPRRTAE